MTATIPQVSKQSEIFSRVDGVFYRAIDPRYAEHAISGSRTAGRYSARNQPTLYLSSSIEGVEAAMIAHAGGRSTTLETIALAVRAERIFDMRDVDARKAANIELEDAIAPWQEVSARGEVPRSWAVRERVEQLGGFGLIDPSRKVPGLWHLVLFTWNTGKGPQVVSERYETTPSSRP
jgi:RES domain-containing protein